MTTISDDPDNTPTPEGPEFLPTSGYVPWTWAVAVAFLPQALIVPGQQPWRVWRLERGELPPDAAIPAGPVAYAVCDALMTRWRYAGQTRSIHTRIPKHTRDGTPKAAVKASVWERLVIVRLVPDASKDHLDTVEETIGAILNPDHTGGGAGRYPRTGIRRAS